jgi:hypothetical protein
MSAGLDRLLARAIRVSSLVDRAARRFDRARSSLVARFAPASVLDAYNDLAYEGTPVYRAGAPEFRDTLFNWETEVISRAFPDPEGRVLIGGAGGGREAFALAARGYQVVAFEPSVALARSMLDHPPSGVSITVLVGRYEDLPVLRDARTGAALDIATLQRFDAAIFGWTSFSHIRTRAARVAALRNVGELTNGPIVVSFYARHARKPCSSGPLHAAARRLGFRFDEDLFTPAVGFYHLSGADELQAETREASLEVVHASFDERDGCWPYLIARRVSASRQKPLTSNRQAPVLDRSGESART